MTAPSVAPDDTPRVLRVALAQINGARDIATNMAMLRPLLSRAKAEGAAFVLTPENSDAIEPKRAERVAKATSEEANPLLAMLREEAARLGLFILCGSIAVRLDEAARNHAAPLANRSLLIAADGSIRARYDKIHLFDVDVGDGQRYRESETIAAGPEAVLAETPWGGLGMTVCYDLRFAALHRTLAQAGAVMLSVPAAFTRVTGMAHWHVLLRARAIETGCYVLAPGQTGVHAEGRETFGHSLVVAPWGEVVADAEEAPGLLIADLDLAAVADARRRIPALQHDRAFVLRRYGADGVAGQPTKAVAAA